MPPHHTLKDHSVHDNRLIKGDAGDHGELTPMVRFPRTFPGQPLRPHPLREPRIERPRLREQHRHAPYLPSLEILDLVLESSEDRLHNAHPAGSRCQWWLR